MQLTFRTSCKLDNLKTESTCYRRTQAIKSLRIRDQTSQVPWPMLWTCLADIAIPSWRTGVHPLRRSPTMLPATRNVLDRTCPPLLFTLPLRDLTRGNAGSKRGQRTRRERERTRYFRREWQRRVSSLSPSRALSRKRLDTVTAYRSSREKQPGDDVSERKRHGWNRRSTVIVVARLIHAAFAHSRGIGVHTHTRVKCARARSRVNKGIKMGIRGPCERTREILNPVASSATYLSPSSLSQDLLGPCPSLFLSLVRDPPRSRDELLEGISGLCSLTANFRPRRANVITRTDVRCRRQLHASPRETRARKGNTARLLGSAACASPPRMIRARSGLPPGIVRAFARLNRLTDRRSLRTRLRSVSPSSSSRREARPRRRGEARPTGSASCFPRTPHTPRHLSLPLSAEIRPFAGSNTPHTALRRPSRYLRAIREMVVARARPTDRDARDWSTRRERAIDPRESTRARRACATAFTTVQRRGFRTDALCLHR